MTKQLKLSALFVALLASGTAVAGEASVQGYTVSGQSNEIVRNNYGECWKNAYFDKASQGRVECGDAVAAPEPERTRTRTRACRRCGAGSAIC